MAQHLALSRRSLLKRTLTLTAMQLLPAVMRAAPSSEDVFPAVVRIGPSDPEFLSILDKFFPGHSKSDAFALMKDHTVLFKNKTGRRLWAISMRWTIRSKTGAVHQHIVHSSVRSRRMLNLNKGYKGEYRLRTGGRPIVTPHGYFLATPLYLCCGSTYRNIAAKRPPETMFDKRIAARPHLVAKLSRTVESSGAILTTAFDNGAYYTVGNEHETESFLKHFFSRRTGEQDEAASILKLIDRGFSHKELCRKLKRRKSARIKQVGPDHPRIYAKARRRYAGLVLRHLRKYGKHSTAALLKAVSERPQLTPQLLTADQVTSSFLPGQA